MSKDRGIPPCKYTVGQVLGKIDIIVNDVTWDGGKWFIGIDTHGNYSIDNQTYSEEFITEELLPDIDPIRRLQKLKQEAEELTKTITRLEKEINNEE